MFDAEEVEEHGGVMSCVAAERESGSALDYTKSVRSIGSWGGFVVIVPPPPPPPRTHPPPAWPLLQA